MNLRDVKPEPRDVPLSLIVPPELPARLAMDEEKLDELAESIRQIGVRQRLAVVHVPPHYEIIAGHRRYMAASRVGLAAVPCDVYPTKHAALEAIKFAENRYREDMSAAEEAAYFDDLLKRDAGGDTNRLAAQLGLKRDYVERRLLLFQGDPEVFNALRDKKIKIGVAEEINKCTEESIRRYILDIAIRDGATVAVVTGMVHTWRMGLGPKGEGGSTMPAPAAMSAVPQTDYFRCYVCGKNHNVHTMQPINVHAACREAILDPLLGKDADPAATPEHATAPRRM